MNATHPTFPFSAAPPRPLPPPAEAGSAPWLGAVPAQAADDTGVYQHLQTLLEQAPVAMCLLQGPAHVLSLVNQAAAAGWGCSVAQLQARPLFEALPCLRGQGYEAACATVGQTRQVVIWREAPITVGRGPGGPSALRYFDVTFQPFQGGPGRPTDILLTSHEVTEQVLARQRVQQAADELVAINAGLADYVLELTQAACAAQHDAECQHHLLVQALEQAPVAIGLFVGASYVVEVCNATLQALWGGAEAQPLHQPLREVLPHTPGPGLRRVLDEVGRTGASAVAHLQPGPGGPAAPIALLCYPLRDAQGQFIAIAAIAGGPGPG